MVSRVIKFGPLIVVALLYCAGIAIAFCWLQDWTARQTWAVILTGLVIIWYTWETMQLRRGTFAQRELKLRPFVVLEPREKGFCMRNFGHGVALNVRVEDVTID